MEAIPSGDRVNSEKVAQDIEWAFEPVHQIIQKKKIFDFYNIQLEKITMTSSGYCNAGPIRPPYNHIPEDYLDRGRRFAELRKSMRGKQPATEA